MEGELGVMQGAGLHLPDYIGIWGGGGSLCSAPAFCPLKTRRSQNGIIVYLALRGPISVSMVLGGKKNCLCLCYFYDLVQIYDFLKIRFHASPWNERPPSQCVTEGGLKEHTAGGAV